MGAPTLNDIKFHGNRSDYWKATFNRALSENRITEDDRDLILQFVSELQAFRGISQGRQNKLVSHLVTWRHWVGPYQNKVSRCGFAYYNKMIKYICNSIPL